MFLAALAVCGAAVADYRDAGLFAVRSHRCGYGDVSQDSSHRAVTILDGSLIADGFESQNFNAWSRHQP